MFSTISITRAWHTIFLCAAVALLVGIASQVHSETVSGKISEVETRAGSCDNYNVSIKAQNGETADLDFLYPEVEFQLLIDGKAAKQSDLKVGMRCKAEYADIRRRRGFRSVVEAISCTSK